jgi:hypothetical protein
MTSSERAREAERLRSELYDLAIRVYYVSRNHNLYGTPSQKYLRRMENCRKMLDRMTKRLEFFANKTD